MPTFCPDKSLSLPVRGLSLVAAAAFLLGSVVITGSNAYALDVPKAIKKLVKVDKNFKKRITRLEQLPAIVPPAGPQGPVGPQGAQGLQGIRGEAGPVGAQGARGEKGDKGDKGDRGDIGAQGERGAAGLLNIRSCAVRSSSVALESGFTTAAIEARCETNEYLVNHTYKLQAPVGDHMAFIPATLKKQSFLKDRSGTAVGIDLALKLAAGEFSNYTAPEIEVELSCCPLPSDIGTDEDNSGHINPGS